MRLRGFALAVGLIVCSLYPFSAGVAAERCEAETARVVSVQGRVEARLAGDAEWQPVELDRVLCPGDTLQVHEDARAAVVLRNHSILRLDERTVITFAEADEPESAWLDLLDGVIHSISRVPRTLKIRTPFVNAAVEGRLNVGLLDEAGREIPGFGVAACDPLRGDQVRHIVTWKGRQEVGHLSDRRVRLRFEMKDAKVFAFQFGVSP